MKKTFLIIFVFLFGYSLYGGDSNYVKINLDNGAFKEYSVDSIKNIFIKNAAENYLMKIYYRDSLNVDSLLYPVKAIDNIEFGLDSLNNRLLNLSIYGDLRSFKLRDVDSIKFKKLDYKINENVIVMDSIQNKDIVSIDSMTIQLNGTSLLGSSLKVGDIIACRPTVTAPNGFLRRIVSITNQGDNISIETENANLTDVIKDCIISFKKDFTPSDTNFKPIILNNHTLGNDEFTFEWDGIELTDNITADFSASLRPSLIFSLVIEDGQLKQVLTELSLETTSGLSLDAEYEGEIDTSINELFGIPAFKLNPITIMIGPIPVVITSNISLPIGCKATISGSVGISLDATADVGLEYNFGKWNIINKSYANFDSPSLDFSLGGQIKPYAGPQLNVQFYGLEDAFNAYANFLPFVEGEIDLLNSPLWKIWGGFDGNVGIKSEWFKIHKEQTLIEYRYLLKQADDLIISVSPTEARIGDIITIKGSNFGDSRGNSYVGFTIGNSLSNIVKATEYPKWTNGEIQVKIPKGLIAGKVRIFINIGGFPGNMVDFILLETPYPQIVDINPNEGKIGDTITISGLNFGDSQGSSFVSFNGTIAINYTSWSDTQIKVKVPVGATSGKVSVTVNGIKSNDLDLYFTILDDNKVLLINETFEGKLDPRISIITKGVDAIPPGIISTNHFGSSKAFNFGKSTCPVNCFVNNTDVYHQTHYTILRIKFPNPTYISAIKFSTSEMNGNWGSVGQIYIDSKLEKISPDNDFGLVPNSATPPDESVRTVFFTANKTVSQIDIAVWDIADGSQIYIDDLLIYGK